jgi:hypothetical protein
MIETDRLVLRPLTVADAPALEPIRGALGGFVSKEFWHDGYGAEATRALVRQAHERLHLDLVYWFRANKAYALGLDEGRNGWPTISRVELATERPGQPRRRRLGGLFRRQVAT